MLNFKKNDMEKIIVNVAWCEKNFGGSLGDNVPGAVVFTAKTLKNYRKRLKKALTSMWKDCWRMDRMCRSG